MGFPVKPPAGEAEELIAFYDQRGQVYNGLFVAALLMNFKVPGTAWDMNIETRGMRLARVSQGESAYFSMISQTSDDNIYLVGGSKPASFAWMGYELFSV